VSTYAARFHEYQEAMRSVDPSIQFMASSVGEPNWVHELLQAMRAERLAISIYTFPAAGEEGTEVVCDQKDFYQQVVAEPLQFRDKFDANRAAAGSRLPSHPFFAITEFNSYWLPETKDPDYRLANALYFGAVFNELLRHSKYVFLAESCSLINVQGMVEVNPVAIKLTPPYFSYVLYVNHIGSEVLKTEATVPAMTFNSKLPALDAIATRGPDGRTLYLAVVNRALDEAVSAQINLKGWEPAGTPAQVYELDGRTWDAFNPYGSTENVNISHRELDVGKSLFSYLFPPHTVTVLEIGGSLFKNP
jgi:hypothetical protein